MKIIDQTPFQDEKGQIGPLERVQGTFKYGFSWYPELEAQKIVIAQLDRALEKGFVLIRNLTLPGSEIVVPIIMVGLSGVYAIYATHLSGFYEAKGDQWNIVKNGRAQPAPINLMSRAARLARAVGVYLQRQGIVLPMPVEAVLIAANPAMHIDSMRPAVRVVMSDAIKQFAASLLQARPLLHSEQIYDLADRIVTPRPPRPAEPKTGPLPTPQTEAADFSQPASRAQAIFRAAEDAPPMNPSELGFAFEEESQPQAVPPSLRETSPAQPLPQPPQNQNGRIMGMSLPQLALLGGIALVEVCVLVGFAVLIFINR